MTLLEKINALPAEQVEEAMRPLWRELLALWQAADEEAYDHGEPCDNEGGTVYSCQCAVCRAVVALENSQPKG